MVGEGLAEFLQKNGNCNEVVLEIVPRCCKWQEFGKWCGRCKYMIYINIIYSLAELQHLQSLPLFSDHSENPYGLQICKSVSEDGV